MRKLLFILSILVSFSPEVRANDYITIATGGVTGSGYELGRSICDIVNRELSNQGVACAVYATKGFINNIESVRKGKADLGISQQAWLEKSLENKHFIEKLIINSDLQRVLSFGDIPITYVAGKGRNINQFTDITNGIINKGHKGSASLELTKQIMDYYAWEDKSFLGVHYHRISQIFDELCNGKLDVISAFVCHPNRTVAETINYCEAKLLSMPDDLLTHITQQSPYFKRYVIPAGKYGSDQPEIHTVASPAILFAKNTVSKDVIYNFIKVILKNIDQISDNCEGTKGYSVETLLDLNNPLPRHPGLQKVIDELEMAK